MALCVGRPGSRWQCLCRSLLEKVTRLCAWACSEVSFLFFAFYFLLKIVRVAFRVIADA